MKGMDLIMNYKDFIENALSEAYENAPFSDDETLFNIVKERASNMEKKKLRSKKPAVIAASIAAAAALTVSAGAALNWDIASLFIGSKAHISEIPETWFQREFREYYKNEEFTERSVSADSEYDIFQALSTEIDKSFDVSGNDVHVLGTAFDGNRLDVLFEVIYDDEPQITEDSNSFMPALVLAFPDDRYEEYGWHTFYYETVGNTARYRAGFEIKMPEDKGNVRMFVVDENERLSAYRKGMAYESGNYVDIDLDRGNVYSYYSDEEISIGDHTITGIRISPFTVRIEGDSTDNTVFFDNNIIATFSDGTVYDLYPGRKSAGDGSFFSYYSSRGILLDAREITELRIGDTVIPIN